jgi:hypothetical protein
MFQKTAETEQTEVIEPTTLKRARVRRFDDIQDREADSQIRPETEDGLQRR